jgi:hypothetical protein
MNQFFKEIEAVLLVAATKYAPEGSEPKANLTSSSAEKNY